MKKIHVVGIGGIGLSGLAAILHLKGKRVSGSDQEESETTKKLRKMDIPVHIGHTADVFNNSKTRPEKVIYSLAIEKSNPELREAARLGIPRVSYPEAVGELSKEYFTIAICGTHGKSTTTAMISKILIENNFDPTVIVGTKLREFGGDNFRLGKSKILVLEACEYKRAFLNYRPRAIICHTIEADHLDYYKNLDDYKKAFEQFAVRLPKDGYFFGNIDDDAVQGILQKLQKSHFPSYNMFSYGMKHPAADFLLKKNSIWHRGKKEGDLRMQIPGIHNRSNALAAYALCATLGVAPKDILKSLYGYKGTSRRLEEKGRFGKTLILDDYAHHPTEIRATLQALREKFGKKKICVVFQPHQYSRTKKLFKEFTQAFGAADEVIIPNIYEVRDDKKDRVSVSAEELVKGIQKNQKNAKYGEGMENTTKYLKKKGSDFDVIITMGAGDVWKIGEALIKA